MASYPPFLIPLHAKGALAQCLAELQPQQMEAIAMMVIAAVGIQYVEGK